MKMQWKAIFVLSALLLVSFVITMPVSTQRVIYRATGTLDTYPDYTDARIIQGNWVVTILDNNDVHFQAHYLEENIIEENPGTIDQFTLLFLEVSPANIIDSECTFTGILVWYKIGWDSEVYTEFPPGKIYFSDRLQIFVRITINPSEFILAFESGPNIIVGSTLSLHA